MEVRERIRINGAPISQDLFAKYFFEVWDRLDSTGVGFIIILIILIYFFYRILIFFSMLIIKYFLGQVQARLFQILDCSGFPRIQARKRWRCHSWSRSRWSLWLDQHYTQAHCVRCRCFGYWSCLCIGIYTGRDCMEQGRYFQGRSSCCHLAATERRTWRTWEQSQGIEGNQGQLTFIYLFLLLICGSYHQCILGRLSACGSAFHLFSIERCNRGFGWPSSSRKRSTSHCLVPNVGGEGPWRKSERWCSSRICQGHFKRALAWTWTDHGQEQ